MKPFFNELVFGRNSLLSGLIAIAVVATFVLGCNCSKNFDLANLGKNDNSSTNNSSDKRPSVSDETVPSNAVVEGLVRDTIAKFSDSVESGDFSDIYDGASSDFQSTYSIGEMKTAFKSYTDKKSVVVPIMKKTEDMSAVFSTEPGLRTEKSLKILMVAGEYKTKPFKTRFDFEYVLREGEWKLLKLVINIP